MQARFPSHKRLVEVLNISDEQASLIRKIWRKEIDPADASPIVEEWERTLFHRPKWVERAFIAIDAILKNHGIESEFEQGEMWPYLEYSNSGDCYNPTILRHEGRWKVGCVADFVK